MVKYLLSTDCTADAKLPDLKVEDFAVRDAKNDYELPWILRGVMDDPDVKTLFDAEITELKENILSWNPTTRALRDMKKRVCAIGLKLVGSYIHIHLTAYSWNRWPAERLCDNINRRSACSGHHPSCRLHLRMVKPLLDGRMNYRPVRLVTQCRRKG